MSTETDRSEDRFDERVRAMLVHAEARAPMPADLAERLGASIPAATNAGAAGVAPLAAARHRLAWRRSRWMPPLLAAAAIAVVAVGAAAVSSQVDADRAPAGTTHPTHSAPVRPTPVPSASSPSQSQSRSRIYVPPPAPRSSGSHHSGSPTSDGPAGTALDASFHASDVHFLDASRGWAIGNVACSTAPGYCATVARTTDGGRSWRAFPAPPGVTPVDDQGRPDGGGSCGDNGTVYGPCVDQIAFADDRHGYLWGFHSLYLTTDGGATWVDQHARARQLSIVAGSVLIWAPLHDCSSGCPGVLRRADVGSSTWHTVTPGSRSPALFGSTLAVGGSAYFYAADLDLQGGALYRSTDGGRSWQRRNAQLCGNGVVDTVATGPDGSVALRCAPDGADPDPAVQVSTDGGQSFRRGTAPGGTGYTRLLVASASDLVATEDGDSTRTVRYSGDGGVTWRTAFVDANRPQVAGGGFTDARHGVVLADGGAAVRVTDDGGATWTVRAF